MFAHRFFVFCGLLGCLALVQANTEILNFDATLADDVYVSGASPWYVHLPSLAFEIDTSFPGQY